MSRVYGDILWIWVINICDRDADILIQNSSVEKLEGIVICNFRGCNG